MTRLLPVALLCLLTLSGFAQKQDAKAMALLDRARSISAMGAVGVPAYRLEASFETFDTKGQPDGAGTVVQTAMPDGHSKRVVTFRGRTSETVRFSEAQTVQDEDFLGTFNEGHLLDALLEPVPSSKDLETRTVTLMPWKTGSTQLQCAVISLLRPTESNQHAVAPSNAYCMEDSGLVRSIIGQGYTVVLNSFNKLGNLYAAGSVDLMQDSVRRGRLQITSFRSAPSLTAADFQPSAVTPGRIDPVRSSVGATIMAGQVIKKVSPHYPDFAKQRHISGSVTMNAIIGRDGAIRDLEVLTTPDHSLSEAAVEAVRQWQYKPFLMDGKPVEVDTTITVNFSFGR